MLSVLRMMKNMIVSIDIAIDEKRATYALRWIFILFFSYLGKLLNGRNMKYVVAKTAKWFNYSVVKQEGRHDVVVTCSRVLASATSVTVLTSILYISALNWYMEPLCSLITTDRCVWLLGGFFLPKLIIDFSYLIYQIILPWIFNYIICFSFSSFSVYTCKLNHVQYFFIRIAFSC